MHVFCGIVNFWHPPSLYDNFCSINIYYPSRLRIRKLTKLKATHTKRSQTTTHLVCWVGYTLNGFCLNLTRKKLNTSKSYYFQTIHPWYTTCRASNQVESIYELDSCLRTHIMHHNTHTSHSLIKSSTLHTLIIHIYMLFVYAIYTLHV